MSASALEIMKAWLNVKPFFSPQQLLASEHRIDASLTYQRHYRSVLTWWMENFSASPPALVKADIVRGECAIAYLIWYVTHINRWGKVFSGEDDDLNQLDQLRSRLPF